MSQNIDATFNRSTNNRTINDRTICVKNDNYLTAQQLLCVVEHSLTRSSYRSIRGQTIITVKHPIEYFLLPLSHSFVFLLKIKVVKQNVFTFFLPIVVNLFHIFFYQNPLFSFEMEILTSQKGKPQLALDGFLYVIDKNDKKIYWKCVRNPECRALS